MSVSKMFWTVLYVCVVFALKTSQGFYLPGLAPVTYCKAEEISSPSCKSDVVVNVNRRNTEDIPYEYHHFDFCSTDDSQSPVENLDQVVFGERIRPSPYKISFLKNETCKVACIRNYTVGDKESDVKLQLLKMGISQNYQLSWIIDNRPVSWCYALNNDKINCSTDFPMGCYVPENRSNTDTCTSGSMYESKTYYLFNHFDITITYHSGEGEDWGVNVGDNGGSIISVKVIPRSIKHRSEAQRDCVNQKEPLDIPTRDLNNKEERSFIQTYSAIFVKNNTIKWSTFRGWDYISESNPHTNIEWLTILISLVILLFCFGMVAMILHCRLRKYTAKDNRIDSGEDALEEFGWKSVHGDVFRPPRNSMLLSVLLGSGTQVFFTTFITLAISCLDFLSPANVMTCAKVLFVCWGILAGYVSVRMYKSFGGEKWIFNVLLTSMLCPGVVFCLFLIMNLVVWSKDSSAAFSFNTVIALLCFPESVPLTFFGGYLGSRQRPIEHPVRTNQTPREIPVQSIFTHPFPGIIVGGALPFGCIFIQLFFILNSLWSGQMYYTFGLLFLVFILLVITCSEVTVLLCYFHLRAEDYCWCWRSFFTSGFTAFYFFVGCYHNFLVTTKPNIEDAASIFYWGYTLIMVLLFFLLTGTIGFFACFWFVRKIYSVVKVD